MKNKILSVLLFVLVLNTGAFGMIKSLPDNILIERSELILLARVENIEDAPGIEGRRGLKINTLQPIEVLKGDYREAFISFDANSMEEDSPEFPPPGKLVLLFLYRNKETKWSIVNRIQGICRIDGDRVYGLKNITNLNELREILQTNRNTIAERVNIKSQVISNNWNIGGVVSYPGNLTKFTLNQPSHITLIENYHYGNRKSPGTMLIKAENGKEYGPYTAVSSPTVPPYALLWYWQSNPNIILPPGTYIIIDSDPATWSHNSESGGSGFSKIEGYPVSINNFKVKDDERSSGISELPKNGADHKLSDSSMAKEYYERGIHAKSMAKAIKEFTKALELDPTYAEAYLGRGDAYSGLENAKEAIKDFNDYLALRPKDVFAYLKRAVAYSYAGEFQKAIEDMDRVLAEFPKEAKFYYERGQLYEAIGKKHQAIDDYKKAAKLGDDNAEAELKERGIKW